MIKEVQSGRMCDSVYAQQSIELIKAYNLQAASDTAFAKLEKHDNIVQQEANMWKAAYGVRDKQLTLVDKDKRKIRRGRNVLGVISILLVIALAAK